MSENNCNSLKPRILYVDDDQDACEMIGLMLLLEAPECAVTAFTSVFKALNFIKKEAVSLFILDYALPEISGIELCRMIRRTHSSTPIMFYSAMARHIDKNEAFTAGANAYLVKPNDLDIFTQTVRKLLTGRLPDSEN